MKLLSYESPIIRFLNYMWNMIAINLITLVCCIPVLTIGAAWTAMFRTVRAMHEGDAYLFRCFFKTFRDSLKIGLLYSAIVLIFGGAFVLYIIYLYQQISSGNIIAVLLTAIISIVLLIPLIWLFPLEARFKNTAKATVCNAVAIGIRHFPTSVVLFVLRYMPIIILAISVQTFIILIPFWLLLWFVLEAWVETFLLERVFPKYMPADD